MPCARLVASDPENGTAWEELIMGKTYLAIDIGASSGRHILGSVQEGKLVLDPYIIKEIGGYKIGFVGVTTPETLTGSTPKYFQDEEGNFIYGFFQDATGQGVYDAVQSAVDAARADGAVTTGLYSWVNADATADPYRETGGNQSRGSLRGCDQRSAWNGYRSDERRRSPFRYRSGGYHT